MRWEGGKGGMVVKWKGGRVMRWKGGEGEGG